MKEINILLDMDGVLADFTHGAINVLNQRTKKNYTVKQYAEEFGNWGMDRNYGITKYEFWLAIGSKDEFWFKLKPFPWALDLYKYLCSLGNVTIVTTPSLDPDCAAQKLRWLDYYLRVKSSDVFIGGKKYLMAGNGILIDDYPVNCEKFAKAGGEAICVPSNWNTIDFNEDLVMESINQKITLAV